MRADVPVYSRLAARFWSDEKVVRWPDDMKIAALYFLSNRHRRIEGIYQLPLEYVCADLGWSRKKVRQAITFLEEQGFLRYDATRALLLIRNALRYQSPESENVITGATRRICDLPHSSLLEEFLELARKHCSQYVAPPGKQNYPLRFSAALEQLLAKRRRTPIGDGRQEPASDQVPPLFNLEPPTSPPEPPICHPPPTTSNLQPPPPNNGKFGEVGKGRGRKDDDPEPEGTSATREWFKRNRPDVISNDG